MGAEQTIHETLFYIYSKKQGQRECVVIVFRDSAAFIKYKIGAVRWTPPCKQAMYRICVVQPAAAAAAVAAVRGGAVTIMWERFYLSLLRETMGEEKEKRWPRRAWMHARTAAHTPVDRERPGRRETERPVG